MYKKISIDELTAGMYVVDVLEQEGELKIKTKGWVKSDVTIKQLRQRGVLLIAIDPSKTLYPEQKAEPTEEAPKAPAEIKKVSVEAELRKAGKLYDEAKTLQMQALEDIKAGRPLDIEPMREMTGQFIDSIFRNEDALACMTRIREKDAYLLEHSLNVSILMSMFAKHLKLDREIIHELATGAFLHDVGKIAIPDNILHKPGRLTPEEFDVMKSHVNRGMEVLKKSPGISDIAYQVVEQHHEKLSGNGYPNQISGDDIGQWGRMIAIVDIYDAITAERVYKKGMPPIGAFKIMMNLAGQELDQDLLQQFIKCVGVHPVGTLVKLSSGKLGIVTQSNKDEPLKPIVKIFYSAKHNHYTDVKDIDLSKPNATEVIESSVKPEQFKIELNKFFREVFLN